MIHDYKNIKHFVHSYVNITLKKSNFLIEFLENSYYYIFYWGHATPIKLWSNSYDIEIFYLRNTV